MSELQFDPDVFHGELTVNRGQVFVRAARPAELADCTLHGYVHGPRCELAHTLPAKFTLQDLGTGPTLLARTTITDPCYWTSDLPQLYDVHVELRRGSEVLAREQRMIGLRGIGARDQRFVREGKAWIPRGVSLASLAGNDITQLREQLLVGVCSSPPLDLLVEASRRGVYLIVHIDATQQDAASALHQLARWPAVMMAVIHGADSAAKSLAQVAPNVILSQPMKAEDSAVVPPAAWASAMVAEVTDSLMVPTGTLPILVQRKLGSLVSADAARAACDQLQRDFVAVGQFAGYLA
ncbi:hypothetical protein NA78x_006072 [Anatilimnocola sp. NA78]|uniref:hypothetical protein n=1 Tax=Anatilimnocola sp. NA78 TaxID=3415683 RepID=UPI003CE524FB